MNNYLAKPVRADTLKQMLESYLKQPAKAIPNLQEETNDLVNSTLSQEHSNGVENEAPVQVNGDSKHLAERPRSAHRDTVIRLKAEEPVQEAQNMPIANKLKESARPPNVKRTSSKGTSKPEKSG